MTCTTTNRPRMAATYAPGTVRARRWHRDGDVRGYRPPSSRTAHANLTDIHPINGPRLAACRMVAHRDEEITAISTTPRPFRIEAGGKYPGTSVAAPGFKRATAQKRHAALTNARAIWRSSPGALRKGLE